MFTDDNSLRDTHAAFTFDAFPTSMIRIVATDAQECEAKLDPLTLHFGAGRSQALTPFLCQSACGIDYACFDPTFTGPWPTIFHDQLYPITIP